MKRKQQLPLHLFPKVGPDGKRWTLADQGNAALHEICGALNSETHAKRKKHLRELVATWQASGPNLVKMLSAFPELDRYALSFAMRTIWFPTDGARAELFLLPDYEHLEQWLGPERGCKEEANGKWTIQPEGEAFMLFHLLTVIPNCERLGGPCPRCDTYYIKKKASQKVYCSRRCGNATTAVARTSERVASERRSKLNRASAAMKKWETVVTPQDWKQWVFKKTRIDPRFLTRAVNKGDLALPKKEK